MKTQKLHILPLLAIFLAAVFVSPLHAEDNYSVLMNKAGMQRMLSQQLAKAYLYNGQGISQKESLHQINIATTRFEYNLAALKEVRDSTIQELLSSVQDAFSRFEGLLKRSYNKENAALVIELSEMLLAKSQEVVTKLEELSGVHIDSIINISGRQRMLSQRVAKYYIAYQAGFHDDNTVHQLQDAVSEFASALKMLQKENRNTDQINKVLKKMEANWNIVEPYFLDVRSKGNPLIALSTTDDITKLADQVTKLYVEAASSR